MGNLLSSLTTELRRGTLTLAVLSQRRLEKQELVTSSWDTSESRPRRYYELSEIGMEIYEQLKNEWEETTWELNALSKGVDPLESD
ncbi:PadR family transcriptional regulator [Paenibacillus soyae]|uniref:Helix-turn-helix transcriptional regulator n=1 Tax=Paenibacillus soyae TaxID=2969249 RepID=A0A9X2MST9_9BACL|nr:helix-turn-helix transcriptional regulator [Paenibacillus soyae]MCR2805574.1 helix-turn-helix transcriptional regulator [Paenibacillus soyae]